MFVEDGEEVGSTKNTIDMNHRHTWRAAKIVGCHNPHTVIWVGLVSENRKPMNESALVEPPIDRKRKEKENAGN